MYVVLRRHHNRDLGFEGEKLGVAHSDRRENRWYEWKLYRTEAGTLVLAQAYHSRHPNEITIYNAKALRSVEDLAELNYDYLNHDSLMELLEKPFFGSVEDID